MLLHTTLKVLNFHQLHFLFVSGFWSWRRRSLTDSRQLRTISTSDILESPFDLPGRYNTTSSYDDTNGIATTVLTINNLHRTDVAEYQCVWSGHGDHVTGRFTLDVIGMDRSVIANYCFYLFLAHFVTLLLIFVL